MGDKPFFLHNLPIPFMNCVKLLFHVIQTSLICYLRAPKINNSKRSRQLALETLCPHVRER